MSAPAGGSRRWGEAGGRWGTAPRAKLGGVLILAVLSVLWTFGNGADVSPAKGVGLSGDDSGSKVERREPPATFSIVARDGETGELGVAVQSRVFSVGNGVMWGEAGAGVVATQAWVDVSYGPGGLELLGDGLSAPEVVDHLLDEDPDPYPDEWPKSGRQLAVVDAQGRVGAWTGPDADEWAGHAISEGVSVQGNILAGPEVVEEMLRAFQETDGHLSFRMLAALEAGQAAGGDARGKQSAAMLVVGEDRGVWLNNDVVLRLQVDDSDRPIAELRRLVERAAEQREGASGS